MKQSKTDIKWFSRAILCLLLGVLSYAVTRADYNSAHWVPHSLLRALGASYDLILYAEQNIDSALHFVGAAILVWSLWFAHLPLLSQSKILTAGFVLALCLAAELYQLAVGRGWTSSDLLLGILGCFMAYLTIIQSKHGST